MHSVCDTVGDDGAVLVYGYRSLDIEMPQTVRGFCGVPTAKPVAYPAPDLPRSRATGRPRAGGCPSSPGSPLMS